MNHDEDSVRPVRMTLAWTEQALAVHQAGGRRVAEAADEDPFGGPVVDTDMDTMLALNEARVFQKLDEIPHEGFPLVDSYEESWFDLDQLDGLIAALESLTKEARAAASLPTAPAHRDARVGQWLEAALAFSREAKRSGRSVCFWL